MTPEELRMIKNELNMTREQLLMVILELRKKAAEYDAVAAENSRAVTAMAQGVRGDHLRGAVKIRKKGG